MILKDVPINEVEVGTVLIKENKRYVCIDRDLNRNDDYYSRIKIVSEICFNQYQGAMVDDDILHGRGCRWIGEEYVESFYDYEVTDEMYQVEKKVYYKFQ